MVQHKILDTLL